MSFTRCQRKIKRLTIIIRILTIALVIAAATIIALAAKEPEIIVEYKPIVIEKIVPVPESEPEVVTEEITVTATAYCPCVKCCDIWSSDHPSRVGTGYVQTTYTGTIPEEGRTIAVDPGVIPLGSTVIIGGNEYIAEDIGGGINGYEIDIFFSSHYDALAWGVQTVTAEVVK